MMPSNEIEVEKHYKDENDLSVTIQAGEHGWIILWADGSSSYKDIDKSTEKNFNEAYRKATYCVDTLTEMKSSRMIK